MFQSEESLLLSEVQSSRKSRENLRLSMPQPMRLSTRESSGIQHIILPARKQLHLQISLISRNRVLTGFA